MARAVAAQGRAGRRGRSDRPERSIFGVPERFMRPRLVLLAVGGVCGVAEEAEVLVGQLGDERPQNADAAHAGVEHPDEAVSLP